MLKDKDFTKLKSNSEITIHIHEIDEPADEYDYAIFSSKKEKTHHILLNNAKFKSLTKKLKTLKWAVAECYKTKKEL